jgi:hypothetical protein
VGEPGGCVELFDCPTAASCLSVGHLWFRCALDYERCLPDRASGRVDEVLRSDVVGVGDVLGVPSGDGPWGQLCHGVNVELLSDVGGQQAEESLEGVASREVNPERDEKGLECLLRCLLGVETRSPVHPGCGLDHDSGHDEIFVGFEEPAFCFVERANRSGSVTYVGA